MLPTTRAVMRVDFSNDCLGAHPRSSQGCEARWSQARRGACSRSSVKALADRRAMHAASAYHASELRASEVRVSFARARLIGVRVFLCPFDVIVMQQFAAISLLDGPTPRRNELPFLD